MRVRTLLALGLGALMATAAGCLRPPDFPALPESTGSAERRILVTFVDRSIERSVPSHGLDRYRPRGGYASSSWSSRVGGELAVRYGLRFVAEWPITALGVACVVYEVPLGRAMAELLQMLARDRRVESVQRMHRFRASGTGPASAVPYNDPYYRLQRELQRMRIDAAHRLATGRGVRIALVDSGVDVGHPDLAEQLVRTENLVGPVDGRDTAEVHGTAVAGIISARAQNRVGIVGIAPAAELYALRACWPERPGASTAVCNSFTLALALNEAIRRKVRVVNLSLSGPDDALVGRLIRSAMERGIIVVAADSGHPGERFPADLEGVMAVRSSAEQDFDPREDRLRAPGLNILTTLPHGTYDFMSGSSFAAPHVTGLVALMLEVRPRLTRQEAWRSLHAMAAEPGPAAALAGRSPFDACILLARLSGIQPCADSGAIHSQ